MIGVIDSQVCNLNSVLNALEKIDCEYCVITKAEELKTVDKVIFPGIGNFSKLAASICPELRQGITEYKKPYLGICLGMQLLGSGSDEGIGSGFELSCEKAQEMELSILPHMGWNSLKFKEDPLLEGITVEDDFYFVHSFALNKNINTLATTNVEGVEFTSIIKINNFYGVQFHPEKSGDIGLRLLNNFVRNI